MAVPLDAQLCGLPPLLAGYSHCYGFHAARLMQEREALSAELAAAKRVAATEGKEGLKEERAKLRARADKLTRALECVV